MSFFDTNIRQKITEYLPPELRGESFIDFLTALLEPMQTALSGNQQFETDTLFASKINGQKIVLQHALNQFMGVPELDPQIIIETSRKAGGAPDFFTNEDEGGIPMLFGNNDEYTGSFINNSEILPDLADFIVKIPIGIHTAEFEDRVSQYTQLYKVFGKTFTIETY